MSDNPYDELAALDDFDQLPASTPHSDGHVRTGTVESTISESKVARYEEPCKACRGSGRFYSYTGRLVGPCFKCKGKGVRYFKQPAEVREKARKQAQLRRERAAADKAGKGADWLRVNPECRDWLQSRSERGNEFAQSLLSGLIKFGRLTVPQETALRQAVTRDLEKDKARAAEQAAADEAGFSLREIPTGRYAIEVGGETLLVQLDNVDRGKWAGWVFVKGEDGRLGNQKPGHSYRGKYPEELAALAADPLAAAVAYGRYTGSCCICGRELTNPVSIEAGIGPICAGKFA